MDIYSTPSGSQKDNNYMKKLLIALSIFLCTNAHATTYYFSNDAGGSISALGNNSNNGTSTATPFLDFNGTTLDNNDALSPGDILYFDKDDSWDFEEIISSSNGTGSNGVASSAITFSCYNGTGECTTDEWVKFYWSTEQTDFTQVGATEIWMRTHASGQTHLKTIIQTYNGEIRGLSLHTGTNTTLPEGTFCRSSTTPGAACGLSSSSTATYINPWGAGNPNTQTVRVPPSAHSTGFSDGSRGLISTSRASNARGKYNIFKRFWVVGANGLGFSASAEGVRFENCRVTGAGGDGVLAVSFLTTTGENGSFMRWYGTVDPTKDGEAYANSIIEWSAANGSGSGQAFTSYAPRFAIYNTVIRNNFMAGIDALDYGPSSSVSEFLISHNLVYDNGRSTKAPSYDPNIYVDGANSGTIIGNITYGSGTPSGATNSRANIAIGSEHSVDQGKICHDIDLVNNLSYKGHWKAVETNNAGSVANGADTNDIYNIRFINNTFMAYDAGSFERTFGYDNVSSTADSVYVRNNIFYCDNSTHCGHLPTGTTYDGDFNLWYRRGGSTTLAQIGGVNKTLAEIRTDLSEEANSIGPSDPLFVVSTETAPNVRLQRTAEGYGSNSPAIDAGMESPWTPQAYLTTYFSDIPDQWTLYGTTRVDNAIDDIDTNMDIGFHYPSETVSTIGALTSTNVEPASLVVSATGNVTVSFTTQQDIPSNGKIVVTFPTSLGSGFTFNDGGTTAAGSLSGLDGTLTVGIVSNVVTLTRSGGATLSAAGAKSFVLSFVKNPTVAGSTGVYQIKTTTTADVTVDKDDVVSADTISNPQSNTLTITISGVSFSGSVTCA